MKKAPKKEDTIDSREVVCLCTKVVVLDLIGAKEDDVTKLEYFAECACGRAVNLIVCLRAV